jgi:outer membrane protein OmpA-like peptidoglycan-associated protein
MTRKSLLLCSVMAFAAGSPQIALSEPLSGAVESAIQLAQAATPPADEKDKHPGQQHPPTTPPGQHPPAANAPGKPGPATAQPAQQQQHPGTPPAAQNAPGSQHPGTPPAAQNAPGSQHPGAPGTPPAAQNAPGQHPGAPGAPPAAQNAPGMQHPGTPPQPAMQGMQHPGAPGTPPQPAMQGMQHPGAPGAPQPAMQGMQQHPGAAAAANTPIDPKTQPHSLDQMKNERKEVHEGNRTVITEGNRTIVQEGGQTIIRHDPSDRFRINAKAVNVEQHGNTTVTVVLQPGGFSIVTEVDANGRLLRRLRRDAAGHDVVLIDNSFEPPGPGITGFVLNLQPPVITIAPALYIRDVANATLADISLTLLAPPVVRIERRYALDEILYNEPLRARMPRVDIDTVNFATGSWEIAPGEADHLAFVAQGILAALKKNPGEMFLVEGYTDAVGNDIDNLSLSDHRAESVAEMLSSQFGVPAENLTTQGYGKQFLKVPSQGPERANRRVAVRRITPLLSGGQS